MGSCDGTFAPTGAPAPYTGVCQYSKCEIEERITTNCTPGSSGCSCTSSQSAGVGCTQTVEEEQCTTTDVKPWNSRTNYIVDDVVRLGTARFKCLDWPFTLWCSQLAYSPTLASDGIWNQAWIANGSCAPTTTTIVVLASALSFTNLAISTLTGTEIRALVEALESTISALVEDSLEDSTNTLQEVEIGSINGEDIISLSYSAIVSIVLSADPCPSEEEIKNDISSDLSVLSDVVQMQTAFESSGNSALATASVSIDILQDPIIVGSSCLV